MFVRQQFARQQSNHLIAAAAAVAVLLAGAMLAGAASADSDAVDRGEQAAAVCMACHQADGNGMEVPGASSWPRLAGLNADYLAAQLHAFKSGERQDAEMKPFADMLDDEQIDDVSAYYASLPAKAPAQVPDADDDTLAAGKQLAVRGDWDHYIPSCASCHGPGNHGVGAVFPEIAGQHAGYLAEQLHAWRDGERHGDPQGLMHAVAQRMDDAKIEAVAAWLSRQAPLDEGEGGSP